MQIFVLGHFPLESSRNGLHGEEKRALFDTRASATYTLSPSTIFSQYIVRDIRPMLAIIENALVKKDKRKRGVQTRMQIGIAALVRTQILHASFHPFLHRPCSLFHNIFTPRSSRHPRVKTKKKKKDQYANFRTGIFDRNARESFTQRVIPRFSKVSDRHGSTAFSFSQRTKARVGPQQTAMH